MTIRILATADVHLGRRPTGLLDQEAASFSAAPMWNRIVEQALQEKVDLVLLGGDVVDFDNRFFEALGPLERGVQRLVQEGIAVYAVAGNHDFDVLNRLVQMIGQPQFHLLGRDGRWEQKIFRSRGGESLRIVGRSFRVKEAPENPLKDFEPFWRRTTEETGEDLPTIGLLHGDLGATKSKYSPVGKAELQAAPVLMWVVGHLHARQYEPRGAGAGILVPGSPQGLDPSETGPHGPWLVEIQGSRAQTAEVRAIHWPLAPLRYEWKEVDLSGVATRDEFESRIQESFDALLELINPEFRPRRLLTRLELVGRTPLFHQIDAWLEDLKNYTSSDHQTLLSVEKVLNMTRPPIPLEEVAQASHLLGRLARLIRQLDQCEQPESQASFRNSTETDTLPHQGSPLDPTPQELEALIQQATKSLESVYRANAYKQIKGSPPDRPMVVRLLRQQAIRLLDALYAQQGHS